MSACDLSSGGGRERHTLVHLDVDGAPPNIVFARLFVDDTLVFGTATSFLSRKVDECA